MFPVAIYTFGCKLNQLETEALAASFRNAGFPVLPWETAMEGQGIIIINTCTVTSKADQKSRRIIRKALRENPESCVIVTGCYAHLDAGEIESLVSGESAGAAGVRRLFFPGAGGEDGAGSSKSALLHLPLYIREAMANNGCAVNGSLSNGTQLPAILESWIRQERGTSPFGFMPGKFTFHSRGYLKIQDGCDSACAYCRVQLARGPSLSLPGEEALRELLALEAAGCAELMITGVNISQYRYNGCDLAGLLEYLLEGSTSIALRLSSLEPDIIDERLAAVLAHPRIRPHFHIAVQSLSAAVLKKMGRAYSPEKAAEGAALLRSVKDNPFIACDIIAGFPGENEAEFALTLERCEKIRFAWIHAFPFSKRPGTAAFSFEDTVCERDVTRRIEALNGFSRRGRRDYAHSWLGKELTAVAEKGKTAQGQCRAVSENYLKLLVDCAGEDPLPGSSIRCVPVSLCEAGSECDAIAVIK